MRFLRKRNVGVVGVVVLVLLALSLAGCSSNNQAGEGKKEDSKEVEYPVKPFEFIAPGGPGGGWDTTIRTVAKVLEDQKLVSQPMPVINKPGGGGAVGLAYMQEKKGSPYHVIVYSPPLLLINLNGSTKLSYKDLTPLTRLIMDYGIFVVHPDSPYETINDVMEALKEDPKSVKIAGSSSPGSMDHIAFLKAAKAAGVKNLKEIEYISYQGNEGLAQLMGGHVDLFSTGASEVVGALESGDIRALAVTSAERIGAGKLAEVPTLIEQGINTTFENWRGLFGPPEMPDYAVDYLVAALIKMVETDQWKEMCEKNGWNEAFLGPEEFLKFIEKTNEEYKEILREIGMLKQQ